MTPSSFARDPVVRLFGWTIGPAMLAMGVVLTWLSIDRARDRYILLTIAVLGYSAGIAFLAVTVPGFERTKAWLARWLGWLPGACIVGLAIVILIDPADVAEAQRRGGSWRARTTVGAVARGIGLLLTGSLFLWLWWSFARPSEQPRHD